METRCIIRLEIMRVSCFIALGIVVLFLFPCCDARTMLLSKDESLPTSKNMKHLKILEVAKNLNMLMDASIKDSSNPFDSLAPIPLPNNNNNDNNSPPYCIYPPPNNPQSPSSIIPTPTGSGSSPIPTSSPSPILGGSSPSPPPILGGSSPSPPNTLINPPIIFPGPPDSTPSISPFTPTIPSPFTPTIPSPFTPFYEPSPPSSTTPSPIGFEPSPPVFEPPVVYPPPAVPPPSSSTGTRGPGVWCVAKPSVPDPIIQEAMNYACGSGADCDPIQPNGQCFSPNTILAHASYAFNSYWQRTRVAGGTCSFGGTAILVTVDPSSQGCHFGND